MVTGLVCEMRWHRSSDCSLTHGTQYISPNTTVEDAVSVKPVPAAISDKTASVHLGSLETDSHTLDGFRC